MDDCLGQPRPSNSDLHHQTFLFCAQLYASDTKERENLKTSIKIPTLIPGGLNTQHQKHPRHPSYRNSASHHFLAFASNPKTPQSTRHRARQSGTARHETVYTLAPHISTGVEFFAKSSRAYLTTAAASNPIPHPPTKPEDLREAIQYQRRDKGQRGRDGS